MQRVGLQQLRIYVSTDDRVFANTEGFQNLKYCIRSKGFLEHLEELLHPTVLEISAIGVYNTLTVSDSKLADRNRVGQ